MKQINAMLKGVGLAVVALMCVTPAHAVIQFPVPDFGDTNTTAGIFTDANGGKWGAYSDNFVADFSGLAIMTYDNVTDNRWEKNTGGGVIQAAYERGVRNFAAWSYFGTGQMSWLKSDNPQKVWQVLTRTYRNFRKRR
jgi:hypothetical protein